jgi:hypothetical protein
MADAKKQSSPQRISRRRRDLPGPSEDRLSGMKPHRSKRKLSFEKTNRADYTAKFRISNRAECRKEYT